MAIGTSAGGYDALDALVRQFKKEDDAGYCIVLHLSNPHIRSFLIKRLQAATTLPCHLAEDGVLIQKANIYIAQPGIHLMVRDGKILLGNGSDQDMHRPSIDVLFRSAAADYNVRAIGVVLTGCVQDGTSGMRVIKAYGGSLIVQDPAEAEFASMPESAKNNNQVDHSVILAKMGAAITEIINTNSPAENKISPQQASEVRWSEKMALGNADEPIGNKALHTCPECGQPIHPIAEDGKILYYHCATGHICLEEDAMETHGNASEGVWLALRMMEDREHFLVNKAADSNKRRLFKIANDLTDKAASLRQHIHQLKTLLMEMEFRINVGLR